MEFNGAKIREDIATYGLKDILLDRMKIVRVGGIAESTFYKACDKGAATPLLRLILQNAQEIITEHLLKISTATEAVAA